MFIGVALQNAPAKDDVVISITEKPVRSHSGEGFRRYRHIVPIKIFAAGIAPPISATLGVTPLSTDFPPAKSPKFFRLKCSTIN